MAQFNCPKAVNMWEKGQLKRSPLKEVIKVFHKAKKNGAPSVQGVERCAVFAVHAIARICCRCGGKAKSQQWVRTRLSEPQ